MFTAPTTKKGWQNLKDTFIEKIKDDIIRGDDGFSLFFPRPNEGGFPSYQLRRIADELDRRDVIIKQQYDEYFGHHEEMS